MGEENNSGSSYLMALRQAAGPGAAARQNDPPMAENPPATTAGEKFEGAEKRRSPRYKCEGSAQVCEDGGDVRTWATFSDISLHGCYVEAQATYPAGTLLHMKLEVNGIKIETKGKVRVNYPYLGMGISFEEMSEDNAGRVRQLLSTLARPRVIMGPGAKTSQPTAGPMEALPPVTNPEAAVRGLIDHFEIHQMLMREDFVRLLKLSQK